jgi:hypothetical protein
VWELALGGRYAPLVLRGIALQMPKCRDWLDRYPRVLTLMAKAGADLA